MAEDDLLPETLDALAQAFAATPEDAALERLEPMTLDAVRAFLVARITHLLDRNPALLLHVLYRVDVAERDVKRVFAEGAPADVPGALADLLIERQLQKVRLRRQYREQGSR